ncbi:MAG: hypothetical protein K8U03_11705 [Planctomycetia bacterium]|nr:hypothetical protein [Planctomycetia bacterium]
MTPKLVTARILTPSVLGTLVLGLMIFASLKVRERDFRKVVGTPNLEATYHALLTITALEENPAENHLFLPSVSLGNDLDKHISWGLTAPTKTGDYIYTSYTPPGFVAPYVVFHVLNLDVSRANLARFNFVLGAIASIVLFSFLRQLLSSLEAVTKLRVAS